MSQRHPFLELVSFDICPYVQRSVITLLHKKVDFKLTLIDLSSPPEWFNQISPLGKVPVLLVREKEGAAPTVLFESAVINEYVDEVTPPMLMPSDPLKKAYCRAWIAVGGELLAYLYPMMTSSDAGEIKESQTEMFEVLEKLEEVLGEGPYFLGKNFSLVDSAFAPFFMRMNLFQPLKDPFLWKQLPKTKKWSETLLSLPVVQQSVSPDFLARMKDYLGKKGALWTNQIVEGHST